MLTAWVKKMIPFVGGSSSSTYTNIPCFANNGYSSCPAIIEGKDYQGNAKYFQPFMLWYKSMVNSLNATSSGFAFGSGTTPATENDYTIESIISSGLSIVANPSSYTGAYGDYNSEDDEMSLYIDFTVTNTSQSSITISEICRFGSAYFSTTKGSTPSSSDKTCVLMDRIVLDNPITLAATESVVIRYETIIPLS